MTTRNAGPVITGRGMHVPADVLTNEDVAGLAAPERLAAWIAENRWCRDRIGDGCTLALHRRLFADYVRERIGIETRHVVDRAALLSGCQPVDGPFGSDLGARAAEAALAEAGIAARDLDVVICGTSTPDRIYPATAVEIQHRLGASRAYGYDLLAACSSFVYGLEMARALLLGGLCRRALVVAAEYFSCGVDYGDPNSSFFWGDAGAAAVVEAPDLARGKGGYEILDVCCRSALSRNIRTGLGGTRAFTAAAANGHLPPSEREPGGAAYPFFYQNGPVVYREVVPMAVAVTRDLLARAELSAEGVRVFMFHQASALVLDGIKKRLFAGDPGPGRVPLNLTRYGNTSSCGAAICLAEESAMEPGEVACMTAFGAGYTAAAALLRRVASS